jgi:hypothetical protein
MFSFCLFSNKYLTVTTIEMQSHQIILNVAESLVLLNVLSEKKK